MLVHRVLTDPLNDLASMVSDFRASEDPVWHIDRHVLAVEQVAEVAAAVEAALALCRRWEEARSQFADVAYISRPYVVVDDGLLAGADDAPSPHVRMDLAKLDFVPGEPSYEGAVPGESGISALDELVRRWRGRTLRVRGAFDDEPGAWIVFVDGA